MSQSSSSSDSEAAAARFASVAVNADDIAKSAKAAREVSPCIPSQPYPSFSPHLFLTPPFTQANEKRKAAAIRRRAGGGGLLGIAPIDVKTYDTTTLLDATQLKIAEALQNQLETQFNTASSTSTSNGDDGSDDNHQHPNRDKDNDKDEEVSGGVTLFSRKPRMAKKPVFDKKTKSSSKDTGRRRDRRDRRKHYDSSSEDIEERAKRVAVEPDCILQQAEKAARDASMRFEALLKDEKAAEKAKLTIIRRPIAAATTTIATTTASTIAANL
jgi:hypothetical protein